MSTTANLIGGHERVAYTVEHRGNCVLVTGAVPLESLATLAGLAPPDSVMDADAATVLGVTFAMGLPDDLRALRAAATPSHERSIKARYGELSAAASEWLARGERGMSSEAMFQTLTGAKVCRDHRDGKEHPYDPADFRRCRLLLEQVPGLSANLVKMRAVSPAWRALIDGWAEICAAMDAEDPDWRTKPYRAPHTYQLIQQAIGR